MHSDASTPSLTTPSPSRSPSPSFLPPAQPDHFYSADGDAQPAGALSPEFAGQSWLSPDTDPLATKGIPVFKPTMEEFDDFEGYMERVECWGMRSGIIKIIPPKEWSDALPSVRPQLANVRIRSPIEQHMLGRSGVFRQQNIEKRKALSVREWAELCAREDFRAPAVDEVGLKAAGGHAPYTKRRNKRRTNVATVKDEDTTVKEELEDDGGLEDAAATPIPELATPNPDGDSVIAANSEEVAGNESDGAESSANTPAPSSRKRRIPTREDREAVLAKNASLDAAYLSSFDPGSSWLPRDTAPTDYSPSFCSTLERRFWRNCGLGKPAWYGADTAGSLFTDSTTSWNVGTLPSALSRLLPKATRGLPGVNTPYLYFGMWRATFAWHVEDMDLFSINYIHFGAPKFWYAVPQLRAQQLETTLRSLFPRDGAQCRQFLRHKSFLASPTLLAQSSCRPNTLVQHAGEFVVTYPRGYHAGFNLGFNCAESVNFALESWLEIGRKAQACGCIGDSVRIDVDALLQDREEERTQGEMEKDKPAPKPRTKKPKPVNEDPTVHAKSKSPRKRKSDATRQPRPKKQKTSNVESAPPEQAGPGPSSQTHKIMLKLPKDLGPFPCCLCISRSTEGLLRVHDLPGSWAGCQSYCVKGRDHEGREVWKAHENCAMVLPETWVDEDVDMDGNGTGERFVFGVDVIPKGRWALKCSLCLKQRARVHGAPIQCTKGKCPKAFHISCAREAEAGDESRVLFKELREVEKEVILIEGTPAAESAGWGDVDVSMKEEPNVLKGGAEAAKDGTAVDPSLLSPLPQDATVDIVGLSKQSTPQPNVVKTIKKFEYELLCPQHNPIVAAAKRANKMDRVRADLLAMPTMSRVKLRVSAGVFEVSLLSVNEERGTVEVIWDDGMKREFKWGSLVWGKIDGLQVGQKPSVEATSYEPLRFALAFTTKSDPKISTSAPTSDLQSADVASVPTVYPVDLASSGQNTSYVHSSGHYRYGAGGWAGPSPYYSSTPGASGSGSLAGSQTSSAYIGHTGSAYSPYSYAYPPPPMAGLGVDPSLSWSERANQARYVIPTGPEQQFSEALRRTVASSVAALPPRAVLLESGSTSVGATTQNLGSNLPSLTSSCLSPSSSSVSPSTSTAIALSNFSSPIITGPIPPSLAESKINNTTNTGLPSDVTQAVAELQRLSALDLATLQGVLSTQPALLEAVRTLVRKQQQQA